MPDPLPTTGASAPSSSDSGAGSSLAPSQPSQSAAQPDPGSAPSSNQPSDSSQTVGDALAAFEGAGRFGVDTSVQSKVAASNGTPQRGPDGKFVSNGVAAIGASQAVASQAGQPAVQSQPQAQAQAQYRDYTGLNAEDRLIFEKMSNEGFNKLKPIYLDAVRLKAEHDRLAKENAEIQGRHFYEQPDAYQLTDDYRALSDNAKILEAEVGHWQQQLQVIEQAAIDGQPASVFELVPGPNGEVLVSNTPIPIDASNYSRLKSAVLSKLTEGHNLKQQLSQQIGGYKAKFQSEHEKYTGSFSVLEQKIFGDQLPVVEKAMKSKLDLFPSHMRGRREIQSFAKVLVLLDGYNMLLQQRQGQQNTQAIINRTAASGGPVAETLQPASTNGHQTIGAVMDEFERSKRQGWNS